MAMSKCFYDPSTCQYQSFSIPEKIVYYMVNNATNAETFQKLVETCKYFFKVNPVIVVPYLSCYDDKWYATYDVDGEHRYELEGLKNVKIWIQRELRIYYRFSSQIIPCIYKNDATAVDIEVYDKIMTFEEFLFIAGNAEKVNMANPDIKYKNGKIVYFEDIIENLPKLTYLKYEANNDGSDFTSTTFNKLIEIEHFKNITYLELFWLPEIFNVETMFKYILENKHIQVNLCYRSKISNHYKELIQKYSNLLKKEDGCISKIDGVRLNYFNFHDILANHHYFSSSDDETVDGDDNVSDVDGNEDLLFPWNNEDEDEWELPWDKTE